jgi:hypothetical protein
MPKYFVVMVERSAGNESVGSEWIDTAIFTADTTLARVMEWQESRGGTRGRIMLNYDTGPAENI